MLIFPHLATGALAQYPIRKIISQRSIESVLEDGTRIVTPDRTGRYIQWTIPFKALSDQEADSLRAFFGVTQGKLLPFVFLDPTSNLLMSSEDFASDAWSTNSLDLQKGLRDAMGNSAAFRLHNATSLDQSVTQLTQIPGAAHTCFSIYLRSDTPGTALLCRRAGGLLQTITVSTRPDWQRYFIVGNFQNSLDPTTYSLVLSAGTNLDASGAQVDAQGTPSPYMASGRVSNVFTNARFDMSELAINATGPNRNDCAVSIRASLVPGN